MAVCLAELMADSRAVETVDSMVVWKAEWMAGWMAV